MNFITEIENKFQEYYETTITELRGNHPQYGGMTNTALINIQHDLLTAAIKRHRGSFNLETLSAFQKDEYYKALIQQIYYVLTEGDFHMMSGFDVVTNNYANKSDLEKRYLASAAVETLTTSGLFYSALNGGPHSCRRRGW